MVTGRLPFSIRFNEEYYRQKMMKQIQRGLSSSHKQEMELLTPSMYRDSLFLMLYKKVKI